MHRVIVLDKLSPQGLTLLEKHPQIEHEVRIGLAGDELRSALAEFDGAICRSGVKISADSLEGNRRLKAIVRAGVGTDNIDKDAATRLGIVVMNTPAGNTLSTAELAVALLLAMSRNVPAANQSLREGRWDRGKFMGAQVADKTLGVVGLGRIGQAVAARARALEMHVLGFDPFLSRDRAAELGVEKVDTVKEMLPRVDYLTVHTPLTNETRNLIGAAEIELMKPTARLINCARGGIYNEAALAEALQAGRIAGVALDVYENEPCTDSPLFSLPGAVCTPHLGASTVEAQENVAVEGIELLIDYLENGAIRHSVNASPLDAETLNTMRGPLHLAYRLGLFAAQLGRGAIDGCQLHFRGEAADRDTRLLSNAFAAGLLESVLDDPVNIVNAQTLLRERGIELAQTSSPDRSTFSSVIQVELATGGGTRRFAGTLFGAAMPRLVQLDDYRLEAYLDGILLVFTHDDVPGIIGKVGTIFGRHDVNIAQMSVGRGTDQPGGKAVGVLNLDATPSEAALAEVSAIDHISSVEVCNLPPAGRSPAWLAG